MKIKKLVEPNVTCSPSDWCFTSFRFSSRSSINLADVGTQSAGTRSFPIGQVLSLTYSHCQSLVSHTHENYTPTTSNKSFSDIQPAVAKCLWPVAEKGSGLNCTLGSLYIAQHRPHGVLAFFSRVWDCVRHPSSHIIVPL